jgi:dienelactone hydrolase
MKNLFSIFLFVSILVLSCQEKKENLESNQSMEITTVADELHSKFVTYSLNGKNYQSYAAFVGDSTDLKPVVMIIPEWWGLNDYAKSRADQLANLGYFALAMDFYGDGKIVETPDEAGRLATPFYENSAMAKEVFDAGKNALKGYSNADLSNVVVMGYCFGGAMAMNMGRQEADLKGAVSFHGNLMTGVKIQNNQVKFLVLNGEADSFVSKDEIEGFKKEMDSAKVDYHFVDYPNATHSFTNPDATEVGKKFNLPLAYDKEADEKSWEEFKRFLDKAFGKS